MHDLRSRQRIPEPDRPPLSSVGLLGLLILCGTAVRYLVGVRLAPWNTADQIAWGWLLDEARLGSLRADQLFHYPHEGGSAVLSLMALLFPSEAMGMPALSWVALILDACSRTLQIYVVNRIWGRRSAAALAFVQLLAVPSLLFWSTANFGMHALSSFWPFVILWIVHAAATDTGSTRVPHTGRVTALALAVASAVIWSLDSAVLIPVALGWILLASANRWRNAFVFLIGVFSILLLYQSGIGRFDLGFSLSGIDSGTIRGLGFGDLVQSWSPHRVVFASLASIGGASGLVAWNQESTELARLIWVAGCWILVVVSCRVLWRSRTLRPALGILGLFLASYAISPFYSRSLGESGFITHRHLLYILPLFLALTASSAGVGIRRTGPVLLLLGALGVAGLWMNGDRLEPDDRAAGWVLASKIGDDLPRLVRVIEWAPEESRDAAFFGTGWGLTATLLEGVSHDEEGRSTSIERLLDSLHSFPEVQRVSVLAGVEYAFASGVTPVLDPELLPLLRGGWSERTSEQSD